MKTVRLFFAFLAFLPLPIRAEVQLPSLFSDHALLQRAKKVPVWGKAAPGESIKVSLGAARAEGIAGPDGKWSAVLDLSTSPSGPFELRAEGKNSAAIAQDVLVGEVWLCSGQSNMEFTLQKTADAPSEIPHSGTPLLRQFLVKKKSTPQPQEDCEGSWIVSDPKTSGNFTAVGYYFGKKLQQELHAPVGLINSSWGGSAIEAWISAPSIDAVPDLKEAKEKKLAEITTLPQRMKEFETRYEAWARRYGRGDRADAASATQADTVAWQTVQLPGSFAKAGLPDAGAVWLRRNILIPGKGGTALYVDLGVLHQYDTVFWNGEKLGGTLPSDPGSSNPRRYPVPGRLVKPGENTLDVRIFSPLGGGGISAEKSPFNVGVVNIPLEGEWKARVEYELPPLPEAAKAEFPTPPDKLPEAQYWPTCLYNGMIRPLVPYALAGAIWYQGETNATRAFQYRTTFPVMIRDWRKAWGVDFPFYWCQLANFTTKKNLPGVSSWAELREAQTMTLALERTGQAVLIDLGEENDIHPRNKKDPGERLALIALAQTYGRRELPFAGLLYDSIHIEGARVRVQFKNPGVGLSAHPLPDSYQPRSASPKTVPLVRNSPRSELEGFAICGEDKQWKWANASIQGENVIVWSEDVPTPVAVRYGWANNPTCNLYSNAGLPAVPFRSDDFPITTAGNKF